MKKRISSWGWVGLVLSASVSAAPPAPAQGSGAQDFEYPELTVAPRASERLAAEAAQEAGRRWSTHLPVQVSAASTLLAGVFQIADPDPSRDPDAIAGITGTAVGAAWLGLSIWLGSSYRPYGDAQALQGEAPAQGIREQLTRERAAERALRDAARAGKRLRWISTVTNLATSGFMIARAEKGSFAQAAAGVAAAAAFSPVIFRYQWEDVWAEQADYKKRIYGPVAGFTILREKSAWVPGFSVSLLF